MTQKQKVARTLILAVIAILVRLTVQLLIDELPNPVVAGESGLRLKVFIRENIGKRTILIASQNEELLSLCSRVYELTPYGLREMRGAAPSDPAKTAMERVA